VPAPEQETRQCEEHRDSEVEPAEQPARYPARMPRLKCDMGDDDADGGTGTHPLDRGQEISRSADVCGFGHDDQCAGRAEKTGKRVVRQAPAQALAVSDDP
jgi:hypothetical protein